MLGASFSFTFRERMDFDEPHRIDFTHDPAPGADESAGVVGWYELAPRPAGTHLETSMEITVDLPFPGLRATRRDHRHEGRRRADGPALRAQPARPPRRHDRLKVRQPKILADSGMSSAPRIVVCRKQPYEEGPAMPFRSEPSTPTAMLGDDLVRVVKLLHHVRQQSPRQHPQVDPMAYPLLFNLKVAPMRVSALAEVLHSDVSTVSRQVSTLVDLGFVERGPDPRRRPRPGALPHRRGQQAAHRHPRGPRPLAAGPARRLVRRRRHLVHRTPAPLRLRPRGLHPLHTRRNDR